MKVLVGTIIANKMQGTAVVEVTRKVAHPLYGKLQKQRKRYKVAVSEITVKVGDMVSIASTRPMSKDKYFKIARVISTKAEVVEKPVETIKTKVEVAKKSISRSKKK